MAAFEEDFLQKIVSVHWGGGQWFGVRFSTLNGAVHTWEMDFPGKAGGTPGYIPINNSVVDSRATPHPHTVTASDLSAALRTNAGAGFTGFMCKTLNSHTGTDATVDVLLKMDGEHFPNAFALRLIHTTPSGLATAQTQATVFTVQKGKFKAGIIIPVYDFIHVPSSIPVAASVEVGSALLENKTYNFRINPETLAVVQT